MWTPGHPLNACPRCTHKFCSQVGHKFQILFGTTIEQVKIRLNSSLQAKTWMRGKSPASIKIMRLFLVLSWFLLVDGRVSQIEGDQVRGLEARSGYLRPGHDVTRHSVLTQQEYVGHSYVEGGKGKGKGAKKGGYEYDEVYYGKGGKKAKKTKSTKKKVDKKLKHSSDSYDDDWWMYDTEMEHSLFPSSSPGPDSSGAPSIITEGFQSDFPTVDEENSSASPTDTVFTLQQALLIAQEEAVHVIKSPVQSPITPPPRADTLRMSRQSDAAADDEAATEQRFGVPSVERELFPEPVLLKAHSTVFLKQHDPEFFAETTEFLTPCLQNAYPDHLQAYKLTVDYDEGPDVSEMGVIITHMTIKVVLSVLTDTIADLRSLDHEGATEALHRCFEGPQLYQYLGSLRRNDVEINEIAFMDEEFKSPLFGSSDQVIPSVQSSGQQNSGFSEPKKSRVGLVTTLCVGLVAIGAVAYAHQEGRFSSVHIHMPRETIGRMGDFGATVKSKVGSFGTKVGSKVKKSGAKIRRTFRKGVFERKLEQMADSLSLGSIGRRGDSSSDSSENEPRKRSWSGSFRRHPTGGVKPAAIQKKGARSEDYLKKSSSPSVADDYSFSVGDDYNVPVEYDFQATPMSVLYTGQHAVASSEEPSTIRSEEEFSMPDDYNTVQEEMSLYSRNMSVAAGTRGHGAVTPSFTPQSSSALVIRKGKGSGDYVNGQSSGASPNSNYMDEWSYNSYTTSSPAQAGADTNSPPPYRDWNDEPQESPGSSGLNMPRLS